MARTRRLFSAFLAIAAAASLCTVAEAQSRGRHGGRSGGGHGHSAGGHSGHTHNVSGTSLLTRSRPPMGLGGVRSKQPRGIGKINGTLLPQDRHQHHGGGGRRDGDGGGRDFGGRDFGRGGVIHHGRSEPIARGRAHTGEPFSEGVRGHVGTQGTSIHGHYSDDNFKLGFHLGAGGFPILYHTRHHIGYHRNYGYYGYYGYNDYPYDYAYGTPMYIDPVVLAPAPPPEPEYVEPEPATPLGRGELALRRNDGQRAVAELREHLKASPNDGHAIRLLSVALLKTGNVEEAVAVLTMAYEREPSLAWSVLDAGAAGWDGPSLRAGVQDAVGHAHKVKSASAWLMVTVLMQAEGRNALALKMLGRATSLGLPVPIAGELERALKP